MPEALRMLMWLRVRGTVRGLLRGAKRPRGFVYLVIGALVLSSWLCSSLFGVVMSHRQPASPTSPLLINLMPLLLLVYALFGVLQFRSGMIIFSPAEIDFLFPGPFARRELLAYKLVGKFAGCLASAAFISIAFSRHASNLLGLYAGLALTLIFLQLVPIVSALGGLLLAERVKRWGRVAIVAALVVLALAALAQAPPFPVDPEKLQAWWGEAQQTWGAYVLLAPFQVFVSAALAPEGYPFGFLWLAGAAGIDALLLALVFWLDANYLESAVVASEARYELLQRAKQGRRTAKVRSPQRRGNIPLFGWWGGAGPTAWRQLTTALRTGRVLLILGPIAFGGTFLVGSYNADFALGGIGVMLLYLLLILVAQTRYDFRGELDNIPWLKTLPVSSLGLVLGELVAPVVLTSLVLLGALAGLVAAVDHARGPLLGGAALVVPLTLWIYAIENLFFLLFPSRSLAINFGELQSVGRFMVIFAIKGTLLAIGAGLTFGFAALAYWLCGSSFLAGGVVAWLLLVALALSTLPCVAWAYSRFDPGVDIPA